MCFLIYRVDVILTNENDVYVTEMMSCLGLLSIKATDSNRVSLTNLIDFSQNIKYISKIMFLFAIYSISTLTNPPNIHNSNAIKIIIFATIYTHCLLTKQPAGCAAVSVSSICCSILAISCTVRIITSWNHRTSR